jgi:predicted metal-dependent phosphoesterase TrpH
MAADLHLHTHYSDGTFTVEEVVARAAHSSLTSLALTDHDTVEGCEPMAAACARAGIEFFVGTELTAETAGVELHLLGFGFDPHHAEMLQAMARFQHARRNRIYEMAERLNRLSVPLQAEEVLALAQCRSPGRPHVARALVQRGVCSGVDEAFARFLKKGRPAWVPKAKVPIEEAIQLVHRAGGVAVLAHPGLSQADPYLPMLIEHGLDGLECYHTKHAPATAARYEAFARQHHLLITGGSDCHGMAKAKPLIGSLRLDPVHLVPLRHAIAQRHPTAIGTHG